MTQSMQSLIIPLLVEQEHFNRTGVAISNYTGVRIFIHAGVAISNHADVAISCNTGVAISNHTCSNF